MRLYRFIYLYNSMSIVVCAIDSRRTMQLSGHQRWYWMEQFYQEGFVTIFPIKNWMLIETLSSSWQLYWAWHVSIEKTSCCVEAWQNASRKTDWDERRFDGTNWPIEEKWMSKSVQRSWQHYFGRPWIINWKSSWLRWETWAKPSCDWTCSVRFHESIKKVFHRPFLMLFSSF